MPDIRSKNLTNMTFTTSSGKDVKDTQMLKGSAQDSLFGKNVTKQDVRSGGKSSFGTLGGQTGPK